jgi:hypothetical protein
MRIFYGLLICLIPFFVQAQQLRFNASSANIDSFPIVRFNITVSENASIPIPALVASDFTVTDDAQPVSAQLIDCDDSRRTAVVICIDHSSSMVASVGDGFDVYPNFPLSFQSLLGNLKPQSKYALLPFTDQSNTLYPEPPHLPFYQSQDPVDLADAMGIVNGLSFTGGTDVDKAIFKAASALEYSGLQTKAIVIVTDEFIRYPDSVLTRLEELGIMLCVFQAGSDFSKYSFDVAQATGGLYFQVSDSSTYDDIMLEIAEHLSAEHCVLRYTSPDACPWYKAHQVSLVLTRGSQSRNILRGYTLGYNVNDKTPPPITATSPTYITRRATATGNFPCERGLKDFRDSLRQNIGIFQRSRTYPSLATDSLRVQDSLYPARAIYVAIDSANNRSTLEILYVPQPDILEPQIVLTSSTGGKYRALVTETRPWDRGLFSASLAPGAVNLVFDSVKWLSKTTGQVWFHQPDAQAVSTGCIEVQDSVGNIASYCIDRSGPAGDTLPPVILQASQAVPRKQVSVNITELRQNDRGIKQTATSALANFANQQITWTNNRQATLKLDIIDSLTSARAFISATDSADNVAADSIRYDPLPDLIGPTCVIETIDVATRKFRTTDRGPWDRGIRDVAIVGAATNLTFTPAIFINRFEAEQTFVLQDQTIPGNVVIRSTDSVGHECLTTIDIAPLETSPTPLLLFETASNLDFGKVFAPGDVTLPLNIKNPNNRMVVVTKLDLIGDGEFSVTNSTAPMLFAPLESKTFDIRYQPNLLGVHQAKLTLANDTITLSQTDIIGQAIGRVRLYLESVSVSAPEVSGTLHLSIEATPDPINLDNFGFTIVYNRDVAVLSPQLPDCAGGNPLCDYTVNYIGDPESGVIAVQLTRNNFSRNQSLSRATAKIDIPFVTFLSKDAATNVVVEDPYASQSSVITSDTGVIQVGSDGCGVEILRAFIRDNAISIKGIKPNPASGDVILNAYSDVAVEATLALYQATGICATKKSISLAKGANNIVLKTNDLANGYYTLTLSTINGFATATLLVQR